MIVSGVESTIWSAVLEFFDVRSSVDDANGELANDCILDILAAVEENDDDADNDDFVCFDDITPRVDAYLAVPVLTAVAVVSSRGCSFLNDDILLLTFCTNEPSC